MKVAVNLLKHMVESSSTAMVILRCRGLEPTRAYANAAFQKLTGLTADDVTYSSLELFELLHGENTDLQSVLQVRAAVAEGRELRLVIRSYRKDETSFWNLLHVIPIRDEHGNPSHCLAMLHDVTDERSRAERLELRAHHDPLTGLPNRHVLSERLDETIAQARPHSDSFALVVVDVNHFKQVNDSLGHDVGDELLKLVAARLEYSIRTGDIVCRVGGDEFVLLLRRGSTAVDVPGVLDRINEALSRPVVARGHRFEVSCSIGVSVYPHDGQDRASLFKKADADMYRNKVAHHQHQYRN